MYISLDTEGGGLDTSYSLLTASFIVFDEHNDCLDSLNLKLKPKDGKYMLSAEAMAVNRIDIVEHDKAAITYEDGRMLLKNFLLGVKEKYGRLTAMGQHIDFDFDFIFEYLIDENDWLKYVDRRPIDLISISRFFQIKGLIPKTQILNLQSLCKYFEIDVDDSITHTADFDTSLNIKLFKKYLSYEIK